MRYHYTSIGIAQIKNSGDIKSNAIKDVERLDESFSASGIWNRTFALENNLVVS